jgi:PhnB protein
VPYLTDALGAREVYRLERPNGSVRYVEMHIGDSAVRLAEPDDGESPMPGSLHVYVWDCDSVYWRALQAGGEAVKPVATLKHTGERIGAVRDPSGNIWWIASRHSEDPKEAAMRPVTRQIRQSPELGSPQ